jgi:ubiquinone/menaquinone biosynthesis C-methylase UbiE
MHEKRFGGDINRLRFPERVERLEVERVVDLCLKSAPGGQVLDVGTGTGLFAQAFAQRGLAVSGVDVNPDMLAAARGFVPEGDFREGTLEALPFPDGSFDLVFLGLVLHESDETLTALKEVRRVTRRQVFILEWPYRDQPFGPPLSDRLDPANLASLFKQAGFRNWSMSDLTNTSLFSLEV